MENDKSTGIIYGWYCIKTESGILAKQLMKKGDLKDTYIMQ